MTWECSRWEGAGGLGSNTSGRSWNRVVAGALRQSGGLFDGINSYGQSEIYGLYLLDANYTRILDHHFNNYPDPRWVEIPNGYKWRRYGAAGFTTPAAPAAHACLGHYFTGGYGVAPLASTSSFGLIGQGQAADIYADAPLGTPNTAIGTIELSFVDSPGMIPVGVKANKAFRMYLLYAMCKLGAPGKQNQGVFFGTGTAADQLVTVNLRSGSMPADGESAPTGTILASCTVASSDMSSPDKFGRFYLQSSKVMAAAATGAIGYAEVLGATASDGVHPTRGQCRLYIPVASIPTFNSIAVDSLATTAGQNVTLYDFGLQVAIGV